MKVFATQVLGGTVRGATGHFRNVLLIGIGDSALGPQFVASALGQPARDKMSAYFLDNTDLEGIDNVLSTLRAELDDTPCVVATKVILTG